MKVISGFFTLLALIAFSTFSSADQLESDLNTCTVERGILEERVKTLENESLIALETYQKKLDEASSATQAPITRKTTTEATTTSTSTTNRPDYRCGTLLDVATNDITVKGFFSGTYKDGSPLYPGVGNFASCNGDRPARVYRQPNLAIQPCTSSEHVTDQNVRFVGSHPNLKWVSTDRSSIERISGHIITVKQSNNKHPHYITRVYLGGYHQIGLFQVYGKNLWYWEDKIVTSGNVRFEVLVCEN